LGLAETKTQMKKFSRFERPPEGGRQRFRISETDLDILETVLCYRFSPSSELRRLVGGNSNVVAKRLRFLWEHEYVNRFAFPDIRTRATENHYYLDNPAALTVLLQHGRIAEIHPSMLEEIDNNRQADYATAAIKHQHMKLGFLHHELMISRMRFMLEMACRLSGGQVELVMFRRGADLEGHYVDVPEIKSRRVSGKNEYVWEETDDTRSRAVEPDAIFTLRFVRHNPHGADDGGRFHHLRPDGERDYGGQAVPPDGGRDVHFCYEADRGTMPPADMLRKFRAYYYFIKRYKKHGEAFGIHPIRAVLVEAPDQDRALKLMEIAGHPLVSGPNKRAGLFWFTISPLFTDRVPNGEGELLAKYLYQPAVIFDREWALPDYTKLALGDEENSTP
jgi:Replication-relaxation